MIRIMSLVALVACSGRARVEHERPAQPPQVRLEPQGPSIYDLGLQLRDANARTIGLDIHRGRRVIIAMFYASCDIACPLLLSEISQTLDELPAPSDARVLMVSFDPERDTPAKLAELARQRHLDDRWTLAAASDADARALAAVLGVKYRKIEGGGYAHGSTIVVLDGDGQPIARTDSLGNRMPLIAALR